MGARRTRLFRLTSDHSIFAPRLHSTRSFYFDPTLMRLSVAMTGQSVVKHFLTEGDKFIVSRISTLENQGGYAVASNYGKLNMRMHKFIYSRH